MQSCSPALCKPDPSAYCAVVADACEFNRGLSRGRASRLPFLDLATQTLQKPAPWLYRKLTERASDPSDLDTQVLIRYSRHRWTLTQLSPAKRRRLAADRLWYNLQTSLGVLGVPPDLVPSVTRRAFAVANLSIPASLASQLESVVLSKTTPQSNCGTNQTPTRVVVNSSSILNMITRRGTEERYKESGADDVLEEQPPEDPVSQTEDSIQSADGVFQKDGVNVKVDEEASGNSNMPNSTSSGSHLKTYDMDDELDDSEEIPTDGSGVGGAGGLDDEEDDVEEDDLDDDDAEWIQPRSRRPYANNLDKNVAACRGKRRPMRRGAKTRFSERRMIRGRHFTVGSQMRHNLRSSSDTVDSPLSARRTNRVHQPFSRVKVGNSHRTSKDKENAAEDRWNASQEPGFQPNSSLLTSTGDSVSRNPFEESALNPQYPSESSTSNDQMGITLLSDGSSKIPGMDQPTFTSGRLYADRVTNARPPISELLASSSAAPFDSASTSSTMYSSLPQIANHSPQVSPRCDLNQSVTPTNRSFHDQATMRYGPSRTTHSPASFNIPQATGPSVPGNSPAPTTTPTATTTVTFFVCEVCSSRYRSTAGLRYHYHSQHSGYTPKNPISASASRLVVPVGEERGIGGGLRGGRPRRHKTSTADGRNGRSSRGAADFDKSKTPTGLLLTDPSTGLHISNPNDAFRGQPSTSLDPGSLGYNRSTIPNRMTNRPSSYYPESVDTRPPDGQLYGDSRMTEGMTERQRVLDHQPFTHSWHPQGGGPYSTPQQAPPNTFPRLTPSQRRLERQRCPDRVNPGSQPTTMLLVPTCVYCLGDERMNPRLGGRPEGLLRCARCGSWAHFSCLHLPTHVIDNAMRYPWQCIECKSCWLCGSPEQENRMIFCGDCDRVFHVDCLPVPPSRIPPISHWSCDICLHDLYGVTDRSDKPSNHHAPLPVPSSASSSSVDSAQPYFYSMAP